MARTSSGWQTFGNAKTAERRCSTLARCNIHSRNITNRTSPRKWKATNRSSNRRNGLALNSGRPESGKGQVGTERDDDYWAPTDGNAGYAASILLGWAKQHPEATWRVS